MIFYFSATGNCKYVAKRLSEETGEQMLSITDCVKNGQYQFTEEKLCGIVSPTYAWGLPSIVADFLKRLELKCGYCFFVATYGTTPAHSGLFAQKYLVRPINALYSVKMPDTWTPMFDLSDSDKVKATLANSEKDIDEVIAHIAARDKGDYMKNKVPKFTAVFYKPYYDFMRKTKHFTVEDSCIGCGMCARKCPLGAIEMRDGKPVWVKDRCVMCLGCLHRCPKFAIQYGKNTKKHGQYQNPNAKV